MVDPNDQPVVPIESSGPAPLDDQEENAEVPKQQSPITDEAVESGDETKNETMKEPHPAPVEKSASNWQAFADVPRGIQVSINLGSH